MLKAKNLHIHQCGCSKVSKMTLYYSLVAKFFRFSTIDVAWFGTIKGPWKRAWIKMELIQIYIWSAQCHPPPLTSLLFAVPFLHNPCCMIPMLLKDKSKWTIYHWENYIIWLQSLKCPLKMGINMGQWEAHTYINPHSLVIPFWFIH